MFWSAPTETPVQKPLVVLAVVGVGMVGQNS